MVGPIQFMRERNNAIETENATLFPLPELINSLRITLQVKPYTTPFSYEIQPTHKETISSFAAKVMP